MAIKLGQTEQEPFSFQGRMIPPIRRFASFTKYANIAAGIYLMVTIIPAKGAARAEYAEYAAYQFPD